MPENFIFMAVFFVMSKCEFCLCIGQTPQLIEGYRVSILNLFYGQVWMFLSFRSLGALIAECIA
jgi:hypothetical protein